MSVQERVERSDVGRIALSAFLIATIAGIVVWNLPGSVLRDRLSPLVQPYFDAAGLDQGWGVFAPDPRQVTNDFFAVLDYADGTQVVWNYPTGNALIAAYRIFRWQKWGEHETFDEHELWKPAAEWLAATHRRSGQLPLKVSLYRRWHDLSPPGPSKPPDWHLDKLYSLDLTSRSVIPRIAL